jgi:hypothetical protein
MWLGNGRPDAAPAAGGQFGGEAFGADKQVPRLDGLDPELLAACPRVFGEAVLDVGLAFCVDDQQRAEASMFGAGERPREQDEAILGERVHERSVVADAWLLQGSVSVCPARSSFSRVTAQ